MQRRQELERASYLARMQSDRQVENATRDFCRIDQISRDKAVKERLQLKAKLEADEKERREREEALRRRQALEEAERAKAAQLIEERRLASCDKKTRQRLREESEELRILEAQLRTAYVAKENAFQLAERRARQLQEQVGKGVVPPPWSFRAHLRLLLVDCRRTRAKGG